MDLERKIIETMDDFEKEIVSQIIDLKKIYLDKRRFKNEFESEVDYLINASMRFNTILDLFSCYLSIKDEYLRLNDGKIRMAKKGEVLLRRDKKIIPNQFHPHSAFQYFGTYIYENNSIYSFVKNANRIRNNFVHGYFSKEDKIDFLSKYYLSFFSVVSWFVEEVLDFTTLDVNKDYLITSVNNTKFKLIKYLNKLAHGTNNTYIKHLENRILELENKLKSYEVLQNNVDSLYELISKLDKNFSSSEIGQETMLGKLDNLSKFITGVKEDINSKLDFTIKNQDDAMHENVIQEYASLVSDKILEKFGNNKTDKYSEEEKKLNNLFGQLNWDKLDNNSKNFLTTAKVLYNEMFLLEKADYSGVCLLVTKAVENELHTRFYTNFINYLNRKYHKSEWPSFIMKVDYRGKQLMKEYDFTLGSVRYFCCNGKSYNTHDLEIMQNYCKDELFSNPNSIESINNQLKFISNTAEKIRTRFRNPSAHINSVEEDVAINCLEYILDVTKVLITYMKIFK